LSDEPRFDLLDRANDRPRNDVASGTLLCVSDKPLHGEIKLPGVANAFK
jgi:hypothetical protein